MNEWQPIETAPKDGSWFLICRAGDEPSYEVGCFDPMFVDEFIEVEGGLFRKEKRPLRYQWRGFNNMHRASHWMPLPSPPSA